MDNSNDLYEQVYFFFRKVNSTKLIYHYMRCRMNLIFNSDSLVITSKRNTYRITIITTYKKMYWNISSYNYNKRIMCKDGNIDNLFKYIYNKDK